MSPAIGSVPRKLNINLCRTNILFGLLLSTFDNDDNMVFGILYAFVYIFFGQRKELDEKTNAKRSGDSRGCFGVRGPKACGLNAALADGRSRFARRLRTSDFAALLCVGR